MASQRPRLPETDRAARAFLEPALDELDLPGGLEDAVHGLIDDGAYVEALVTTIYFE